MGHAPGEEHPTAAARASKGCGGASERMRAAQIQALGQQLRTFRRALWATFCLAFVSVAWLWMPEGPPCATCTQVRREFARAGWDELG